MSTILMEQTLNKAMKRMKEAMALACVLTMVVQSGLAQGEMELDLQGVFVPHHQVKNYQQARSGGGQLPPLGLPFVDDFAWPSLYEEDAPLSAKRWELSPVRRTQTLAYRPPTIGCATLDGLDASGNPRMLNATSPVGYSDTLTSRRLFLGATLPTDSVALSFWYQSGGIANGADAGEDSLVVEFKTGSGDDPWRWVWSTEGIANDTVFHPVVIPIDINLYFHNDFQFRFRNYGALEGNVDTWHIDYVRVAAQGNEPAPLFEEVAFVAPPSSFLAAPWTAMPWPHYTAQPEAYQRSSLVTLHRSFGEQLNQQENVGLKVERADAPGDLGEYTPPGGVILNVAVQGLFETDYLGDLDIPDLLFSPAVSDSFATFHVSCWEDEVGAANLTNQLGVPDNDSLVHVQTFRDYYAYDDGTAEKAYAVEGPVPGCEVAVGFDIQQPDTLEGVWIHFTPFYDDAAGETFTLKVRGDDPDNPGQPGDDLVSQFTIHEPNYFGNAYDGFTYVPFDAPIPVAAGRVYVGFVQQGEERINIGLDKSTNTNLDHLWWTYPTAPSWLPSEIEGSLMIRPVLRAGKEVVTHVNDVSRQGDAPILFPNPGGLECHWSVATVTTVLVMDMAGREVAQLSNLAPGRHTWTAPGPGVYLFVGETADGRTWAQRWISRP
jgi:hypothetical protein